MSFLLETLSSTNFHPPCCLLQAKTSQAFYYHFNQMYKYPIPGKKCSQTWIKASKKPLNSDKLYHPLGSVPGIKTIVVCLIMIAPFHRHFIKEPVFPLKLSSVMSSVRVNVAFPHKVACIQNVACLYITSMSTLLYESFVTLMLWTVHERKLHFDAFDMIGDMWCQIIVRFACQNVAVTVALA